MNKKTTLVFTLMIIVISAETISHFLSKIYTFPVEIYESLIDSFFLILISTPILYKIIAKEINKSDSILHKLQKSENESKAALNEVLQLKNALDEAAIVAITDKFGKITFVNDKFCEISKYSREELIGQDHKILNSGHQSADFFKNLWQIISSGNVWQGDIKNKNKDGEFYWVKTTIVPLLDETGAPIQYIAIRSDITEAKNNLEKFENLSSAQNGILNGTNYSIISTTTGGIITSFNKGAEEMLGYKAEEVVNITHPGIFHDLDEVVARAGVLSSEFNTEIEPGFGVFVHKATLGLEDVNEWTYIKKDGTKIQVSLSVNALRNSQNKITGYLGIAKDITSEKAAQIELEKTLLFQKAILNGTNYGIISTNLEGTIVAFNKGAEDMLGYKAEEVINKVTPSIIHDFNEVVAKADELTAEFGYLVEPGIDVFHIKARTGIIDVNDWTYIRKDGSRLIVNMAISCLKNEKGEIYGYLGITNDITEKKEAEKELDKLKDLLEQTNKVAEIGGWEADLTNGTIWWSDITQKIHETPNSFIPDLTNSITFYKEGENRQRVTSRFNKLVNLKEEFEDEFLIITFEGNEKWVRTIAKGEFHNGECIKLYGTFQDITERKLLELVNLKNQESLKEAQKLSKIGSWERGLLTKEMSFSDELYNIYEINSSLKDNELEEAWKTRVHHEDLESFINISRKCIQTKEKFDTEIRAIFDNGSRVKYLKVLGYVSFNEDESPISFIGTTQDITEKKQFELELQKAKEDAVAASVAKSDFLANMSHEIRTPLNGIIGFSDLLMKSNLNESQSQYMSIVFQSANSLLDIINDILDFSKIEAGKLELEIDKTDLLQLSSQISDVVAYQVQKKNLELLLNISPSLPRFIWTDAIRLRQILVNLLGNAVKFTEKGEVELKISILEQIEDKTVFRFSVRDTGVGIAPQNIQKIFKAFEQEDSSTTRKFGGTGLGLSITNKLLAMMGNSELKVTSELGEGSTFYFDLTLKAEEGEPIDKHDLSAIKKVLVVDDNANNRLIVQEMLKISDIETEMAEDGIDALMKLKGDVKYDVIIMDYHMPDMDGLETIKNIRRNPKLNSENQPIIILSSSSEDDRILKSSRELGIKQRILKPVKIQQLYDALAKINTSFDEETSEEITETENKVIVTNQNKYKILVADDNTVNLLLAKTILSKIVPNATIITVQNGIEALMSFKKEKPDLVLMDVQMPEMNGYEATAEIRNLSYGTNVPVIALTAGTVLGERERCIEAGMNDYVSKPFVKEDIVKLVDKYLVG